jgi:ketosteroid isomerase-like protein
VSHHAFCEQFVAVMQKGDFSALAGLLHADFVVREAQGLPYAGEYRGIEGWRALSKAVIGTWANFNLQLLEVLGETADTLVVRFALSGRSRRTGTPFETTVMELWRFRDGRLSEIVPYYWDTHLLAVAHG